MTANQLALVVIVMIISMTAIAVFSIHRTGKIVNLTVLATACVHILTTLTAS
ncbi:MAG: hypothetical protein WCE30_07890 [Mycobacterium sp.]